MAIDLTALDTPSPYTFGSNNRLGKVYISSYLVGLNPLMHALFERVVPLRVEHLMGNMLLEVVGLSDSFDLIEVSHNPPTYEAWLSESGEIYFAQKDSPYSAMASTFEIAAPLSSAPRVTALAQRASDAKRRAESAADARETSLGLWWQEVAALVHKRKCTAGAIDRIDEEAFDSGVAADVWASQLVATWFGAEP